MENNTLNFIIEIYINERIQDQVFVNGVDSILKSINPLILRFYPGYDINNVDSQYPVKFLIIDRTSDRKPIIIRYPYELYAWFLSYKQNT